MVMAYVGNYFKEWLYSGKSTPNNTYQKNSFEGKLKMKRSIDLKGEMIIHISAEFPVSSEDIAKGVVIPEIFEGAARVHLMNLENEVCIKKVDGTLLGGNYQDVQIIEYRQHHHGNPFQDGNYTTSSSSSSLREDSASTTATTTAGGGVSPMEIDTEISSESLAIAHNPLLVKIYRIHFGEVAVAVVVTPNHDRDPNSVFCIVY